MIEYYRFERNEMEGDNETSLRRLQHINQAESDTSLLDIYRNYNSKKEIQRNRNRGGG